MSCSSLLYPYVNSCVSTYLGIVGPCMWLLGCALFESLIVSTWQWLVLDKYLHWWRSVALVPSEVKYGWYGRGPLVKKLWVWAEKQNSEGNKRLVAHPGGWACNTRWSYCRSWSAGSSRANDVRIGTLVGEDK